MPRCSHEVHGRYPGEYPRECPEVWWGRGRHMNRFTNLLQSFRQEYLTTHLPNHNIQSVEPETQNHYCVHQVSNIQSVKLQAWNYDSGLSSLNMIKDSWNSSKLILTPGPDLLRLCPRMFGQPNHRRRSWRIVYNKNQKTWSVKYSLDELSRMILAPRDCILKLTAKAYLVATPSQLQSFPVREGELSRSMFAQKWTSISYK